MQYVEACWLCCIVGCHKNVNILLLKSFVPIFRVSTKFWSLGFSFVWHFFLFLVVGMLRKEYQFHFCMTVTVSFWVNSVLSWLLGMSVRLFWNECIWWCHCDVRWSIHQYIPFFFIMILIGWTYSNFSCYCSISGTVMCSASVIECDVPQTWSSLTYPFLSLWY